MHLNLDDTRIGYISETMDYPPIIEYELYDHYKNKFSITHGCKSFFEPHVQQGVNLYPSNRAAVFETCFFVFKHKKIVSLYIKSVLTFEYTLNIKSTTYIFGDYKLFSGVKKYKNGILRVL